MSDPTTSAVLLTAYGTPETLDDVAAYFTHIRGGRRPSDEAIEHLRARYARVGGGTPLRRITEAVRAGLERELAKRQMPRRVYVGMKHWHPYVADTIRSMADDGIRDAIAVTLAPHYSRMSVGAYQHAIQEANDALARPMHIVAVDRWHGLPTFRAMMSQLVRDALGKFPADSRPTVVFTAHSLPIRIREWGDPYEAELLESARAVAELTGLERWQIAWQSAGGSPEPWIGPDILDELQTLRDAGVRDVLQVPIGFVSDHLEVLYDIDVEAQTRAAELGMHLERTRLPNADDAFVQVLADVVATAA